ncbi:MAG: pseudouridine synthase [Chitinophagaceae bacterium]|nr:pseudouridine synthase [Chitinophagaceae bacterium]
MKKKASSGRKSAAFDKFKKTKSNAARKEEFRQEKRKWKKEREEFFEKKKAEKSYPSPGRTVSGPTILKKEGAGEMPLNKFIAHSGVCARRDAALLVKEGKVKVNGQVILEPGHKVNPRDEVKVNGKKIQLEKNLVYILLNKPKDYITTTDDPQNRKTVFELLKNAPRERMFPVGRLDRNTSGVLLLTNDGDLAQQLTHPKHQIKKVYAVTLDRPLDQKDLERIANGLTLEDGPITVDAIAYADTKDKSHVGVEIHSGRNRIVRRIFEHLKYDVKGLDRVVFAGLTKKNVDRGKWRFLSEKEVRDLKHFGKGK